ncbi:MAG: hypothetical protein GTO31_07895, partial [Xanthomonadales bacterium]|nr:hypothetical protein [Xanthomonadales bacterium]
AEQWGYIIDDLASAEPPPYFAPFTIYYRGDRVGLDPSVVGWFEGLSAHDRFGYFPLWPFFAEYYAYSAGYGEQGR